MKSRLGSFSFWHVPGSEPQGSIVREYIPEMAE
jgi:hypothetical protein